MSLDNEHIKLFVFKSTNSYHPRKVSTFAFGTQSGD